MLLSDKRILEELSNGNIVIDPFDARQLGTNSYDCRLGEWYFQGDANVEVMHMDNPGDILNYWGTARQAQHGKIAIRPGTTILAHTQEVIGGRNGYLAKMYSRSTVARSGLSVCRCAGVGDVGYINHWTMEISNHTQTTIVVPVNFRICQLTFEYVGETLREYKGKYGQREWRPEDMLPKPYLDWDKALYSQPATKAASDAEKFVQTFHGPFDWWLDGHPVRIAATWKKCGHKETRGSGYARCQRCYPIDGEECASHGPYLFATWKENGKLRRKYIGKTLPPLEQQLA